MPDKEDNPQQARSLGSPASEAREKAAPDEDDGFAFDQIDEESPPLEEPIKPKSLQTSLEPGKEPPPLSTLAPSARILNPREILADKIKKLKEAEIELEKALERTQRIRELEKMKRFASLKSKALPAFFILCLVLAIAGIAYTNYSSWKHAEEAKRQEEARKQQEKLDKAKKAKAVKEAAERPKPVEKPAEKAKTVDAAELAPKEEEPIKPAPLRKLEPAVAAQSKEPAVQEKRPSAESAKEKLEKAVSDAASDAILSMKSGDPEQAVIDFKDRLKTMGLSKAELAAKVAPLAQMLTDPSFSSNCVEAMAKDPAFADKARYFAARQKMLYEGRLLSDEELKALPSGKDAKELRMICLVAAKRDYEALNVELSPEEYPCFWKTFLLWKSGTGSWQSDAHQIAVRESESSNSAKCLSARLWLGIVKPEDVRNIAATLSGQDAALLRLMLAEQAKKSGNAIAAQVLYTKALNVKPNLYKSLIETLRDN